MEEVKAPLRLCTSAWSFSTCSKEANPRARRDYVQRRVRQRVSTAWGTTRIPAQEPLPRNTNDNETPDAIGFHGAGGSILVECKCSRADYLADKTKIFRHYEDMGMGDARYFAAPKGLLKPDELPDGWGLLEMSEHQTREIKEATHKPGNKRAEVKMLMSAIRRLEISTAVFVRAEEENDALSGAATKP